MKAQKSTRSRKPAAAAAPAVPAAVPPPPPAGVTIVAGPTLEADLIGRICLATFEGRHAALFLDVAANKELGFRRHFPVLRASIDDSTQEGADLATTSLADSNGRVQALWDLTGYDMHFEGLNSTTEPDAHIEDISDLQTAYKAVDKTATWRGADLFDPKRLPKGVIARLWLRGFDRLDSMDFDDGGGLIAGSTATVQPRTFLPGGHIQRSHAVIRCTATFRSLAPSKPTLVLTNLATGETRRIPFDDTTAFQITLSNLCTCVGNDPNAVAPVKAADGTQIVPEDEEFAIYYELLDKPPAKDDRPVPFVPKEGVGAGGVAQCVPVSRVP